MKIAIISDTHDNTQAVVNIIDYLNQHQIDTAFHAGDICYPGIINRFHTHYHGHLHFVFGNNDGELSTITQLASNSHKLTCHNRDMDLEIHGKKIFMNHYTHLVKKIAQTHEFNLYIGGHEHLYEVTTIAGTLFINPGHTMVMDPWQRNIEKQHGPSFVILDLNTMKHQLISIDKL